MKKFVPLLIPLALCAAALRADDKAPSAPAAPTKAAGAATPAGTPAPAAKLPPQMPDVAAPKVGPDGKPNAGFMAAHEKFVEIAKAGKTNLLFLGDSITAGWGGQKEIWEKAFGQYAPANFGIGGDRTQHVLWRIENGELDGIKPKATVLMIGTNNSGGDTSEAIASGVKKIVETIRAKLPETKILLLAIFPRGANAEDAKRKVNEGANAIIAKLGDNKHVFYMDIGAKFLEADGTLSKEIMPDLLHPKAKGYEIWAEAISPKLAELMK